MTNAEAAKMIREDMRLHHDYLSGTYRKALKMAIKILNEEERKIGHWVALDDDYPEDYECDVCGFVSEASFGMGVDANLYNFCPQCGSIMKEGISRNEYGKKS